MVMSIQEEIISLEEQLKNTRGPGSKEKRVSLQEKINEMKESLKDTDDEADEKKESNPFPHGVSEEDMPGKVVPLPKDWIAVTDEQVKAAEKNGTLCGYDPIRKIALIRQ